MSVMICTKCEKMIDTDLEEFDFETRICERCRDDRSLPEKRQPGRESLLEI